MRLCFAQANASNPAAITAWPTYNVLNASQLAASHRAAIPAASIASAVSIALTPKRLTRSLVAAAAATVAEQTSARVKHPTASASSDTTGGPNGYVAGCVTSSAQAQPKTIARTAGASAVWARNDGPRTAKP